MFGYQMLGFGSGNVVPPEPEEEYFGGTHATTIGAFDGSNDYVSLGNISTFDGLSQMSISMWFQPYVTTPRWALFSNWKHQTQDVWALAQNAAGDNELRFFVGSSLTDDGSNRAQTTNYNHALVTWSHIVLVYDGTQATNSNRVKVYKDGSAVSMSFTGTIRTSLLTGSGSVTLGNFDPSGSLSNPYNGRMSDVRVYDDVLTSDEATYLYSAGVSGTNPGATNLKGWWKINEGSGLILYDSSGQGNHGTITNTDEATFWKTQ